MKPNAQSQPREMATLRIPQPRSGSLMPALRLGALLLALPIAAKAQSPLPDSFNPGANSAVASSAVQADGKILVGGYFTALGGQSRTKIGRLNADGTVDTTFDPGTSGDPQSYPFVSSVVVQPDGRMLVGGYFSTLGGQSHTNIARLNADGTLDTTFNPGADGGVNSLALQADAKILVGGYFGTLDGQSRVGIGRLNADGTLDTTFNPGSSPGDLQYNPLVCCPSPKVYSLAVQADGKILVGGSFFVLGGQSRNNIGRLNADGTLDTIFNPGAGADGDSVLSLALQADGKILVGGVFHTLSGQSRISIGRLDADGTLDANFNPGADGGVYSLALQADGKILAGGGFDTLGGQSRTNIGRLNNTGPATESLTFDGSLLTWMRGGSSPEAWRTTFEYSPDGGGSWTNLSGGIRISGGWQLTGLALPTNTTLRARGYTVGGIHNGSGWFVETVLRPALAISDTRYFANGQFGFNITGPAGQLVVVEASSDLVSWQPIWTNTITTPGPLRFSDSQSGAFPNRYYRAVAP